MPAPAKLELITSPPGSDLRQMEIQRNNAVTDRQMAGFACSLDLVWSWQTAAANSAKALGRGSTDTAIASGGLTFSTGGLQEKKAAVTTGTAIGAQTVPASLWASYALDIAAGGTITATAAALNTTGYATEALAIAAVPARVTAKARMGYITVLASASTWIAATDALAGGATGNPATTTNYYPFDGIFAPTGTAVSAQVYGNNGTVNANGLAWTGGRNGVLIPTVLSRGSTDTNLANTAFTFSANGVTNIAKAAVAAGTAFGALGTVPADKWAIVVAYINSLGTISYLSGPDNYGSGYATEQQAIGQLGSMFPTAGLCQIGYVTVKTKAATAFVFGTDALAGGASGNVASATNYYPTPGVTLLAGQSAAQIANGIGTVLSSINY